jgi:hypothetical protein
LRVHVDHLALNAQTSGLGVEVSPLESDEFTEPQVRTEHDVHRRSVVLRHPVNDGGEHVGREVGPFVGLRDTGTDDRARVRGDESITNRGAEDGFREADVRRLAA